MRSKYKAAEIRKIHYDLIDKIRKPFKYKKRLDYMFKKVGDYFVIAALEMLYDKETDRFNMSMGGEIKPYFMDDIFWDVWDMPENKNQPMSLRACGVFSFRLKEFYYRLKKQVALEDLEKEALELLQECDNAINEAISSFGNDFQKFIDYIPSGEHAPEEQLGFEPGLAQAFVYMHDKRYQEAIDFAKDLIDKNTPSRWHTRVKDQHRKAIGNRTIYYDIVRYCEEMIQKEKEV